MVDAFRTHRRSPTHRGSTQCPGHARRRECCEDTDGTRGEPWSKAPKNGAIPEGMKFRDGAGERRDWRCSSEPSRGFRACADRVGRWDTPELAPFLGGCASLALTGARKCLLSREASERDIAQLPAAVLRVENGAAQLDSGRVPAVKNVHNQLIWLLTLHFSQRFFMPWTVVWGAKDMQLTVNLSCFAQRSPGTACRVRALYRLWGEARKNHEKAMFLLVGKKSSGTLPSTVTPCYQSKEPVS